MEGQKEVADRFLNCVCVHVSTYIDMQITLKSITPGTSLVVQWLRIRLPMQATRVRALAREDPTCRGAAGPVSHNY